LVSGMDKWVIWVLIVLVSLVGASANILWKVASDRIRQRIGDISWEKLLDIRWDLQTVFSPLVFASLFLMFVSRFGSIVPTTYMGITQLITAITILSLIFTALLDMAFLKTKYPIDVWIGMALGLAAVYFINRGL